VIAREKCPGGTFREKCLDLTPIVSPGYAYVVPCLIDLPASTVDMVMLDETVQNIQYESNS